jgi:putative membrane protein
MNIWVDANGWLIPPHLLLGCLAAEILYFRGWRLIVRGVRAKDAARARTSPASTGSAAGEAQGNIWFWRSTFFLGALFAFLLASSAPIDTLSSRLLWVHMIQHLLLLVIMAPLLVASAPLIPLWLGLPTWARRFIKACVRPKAWHVSYRMSHWLLQRSAISCGLLIIGTWAWHWPALYDLALTNNAIHDWCEHLTFLLVSLLFWAQVIPSPPFAPRLSYLGRIGCVGIATVQNVVLAVIIGFAQVPLYTPYAHLAQIGGLSVLQDQQFGAGIMWTFGDVPFGIALSILVQRWLASQSDDTSIALQSHQNT